MEDNKNKVRLFLARFFRKHELADDEDIFSLGFVNSLFAMQLVMFLEKEFSIKINNHDLDFANFRTINAIVNLIDRKSLDFK
jgi:acyl carrier protein